METAPANGAVFFMNDRSRALVALGAAIAVVATLYLAQVASPLRTDNDAIDYLRTASALADGRGLPLVSLPLGYPLIIAALDRAGLGSSFFFILANCFFLGVGLIALARLMGNHPPQVRRWTVLLTLLAAPVVRSAAIPLPEAAFFGASMLALWTLRSSLFATGRKRALLVATAFGLACLAVSIRYVGVALFPALVWACIARGDGEPSTHARRQVGPWAVVMVILLAVVALILSRTIIFFVYFLQARDVYSHGILQSLPGRLIGMLRSLGEVVVNLPFSRFKQLKSVYLIVGIFAAAGLVTLMPRRISATPTSVYLVSYLTILFAWPHDSSRLWMPIAPLIIAQLVSTAGQRWNSRPARPVLAGYSAWFVLTGLAGLAYTTRISFAGDDFPRLYGNNGGLSSNSNPERSANLSEIERYNAEVRRLMLRYGGWHARQLPRN